MDQRLARSKLARTYIFGGHQVRMRGSIARTGIPLPVSTTGYNAANELTQWGTATVTYDANGNMLRDGTNSYVWDARNHLASMNGSTISFQYDPLGRRIGKTHSGATTNFLYDEFTPVQELSAGTVTANMLTGLITNEFFARTDSTGQANFLTDGLGSALDLADSTGTVQTQYTYDPFGNTTDQGTASGNTCQYNDWQNDGDGSYFDGDTYYSPKFQRYSSQRSVIPRPDWRNPYTYQPTPGGGSAFAPANPSPSPMAGRKPPSYLSRAAPYVAPVALVLVFSEGEALEGAAELGSEALELGSSETWGDASTLADHFVRHGADFGATSAEDYASQASRFLQRAQQEGLPTKIDADGTIRVYDPTTNTFGAYNPDGTTKTFFQPSSPSYWQRQTGVEPTIVGGP